MSWGDGTLVDVLFFKEALLYSCILLLESLVQKKMATCMGWGNATLTSYALLHYNKPLTTISLATTISN